MFRQDKIYVRLAVPRRKRGLLIDLMRQYPEIIAEFEMDDGAPQPLFPDKSIFINYRRADTEDVCGRIYDRLVMTFGRASVFKDIEDIMPGVDFRKVLAREVAATDVMLVIIGQNWINRENKRRLFEPGDFVRFEIETALERGIPVIPVLVQRRVRLPQKRYLPPSIQDLVYRNAVQVRPDPDFHNDMDRLIDGIIDIFQREE